MARYISSLTSSIVNRYGGVVFHQNGAVRILRAWAAPKRGGFAGPQAAHAVAQQAQPAYDSMPDNLNAQWELFTAYWYPQRVGGLPVYHNSNTLFLQCWVNAYTLGVSLPTTIITDTPPPPPTILFGRLTVGPGTLVCDVIDGDGNVPTCPWVLTVRGPLPGFKQHAVVDDGIVLAGSTSGAAIDIAAEWVAAFGVLPPFFSWCNVTITGLYDGWYAPYTKTAVVTPVF